MSTPFADIHVPAAASFRRLAGASGEDVSNEDVIR